MQDQRAGAAMARIERALQRIETALAAAPPPSGDRDELERLRSAHALLRGRVEAAIGEIDRMADGTSEELR